MKIRKTSTDGESRDLLLKEYFLNAYLIALLKQVGGEARKRNARTAAASAGTKSAALPN